jgi:hypothetical protein
MEYSSGEMGPGTLHYTFEKSRVEDFAVNGIRTVEEPKVNKKLVDRYLDLLKRHPTWTFGQFVSGLHVDAATLRQIENVTHSKLRSAKGR